LLKKIVQHLHKCQDVSIVSSFVIQMLPLISSFDLILTLHKTLYPSEWDIFGWIGGLLAVVFSVLYR